MNDTNGQAPGHPGAVARWGKVHAWWQWHPEADLEILGLLSILATYADDDGYCDPSQKTLGRRGKRTRRTINALIARAESLRPRVLEKEARTRANGGTTSCRYRIVREAPPELAQWLAAERAERRPPPPCEAADTAPAAADAHPLSTPLPRNQPAAEQTQNTQPEPCAGGAGATMACDGPAPEAGATTARPAAAAAEAPGWPTADGRIPRDWQPGEEVWQQAAELFPAAALGEHTALFVARLRSKARRYQVLPDEADDTWLAWLIEDQRKERERSRTETARPPAWRATASHNAGVERFNAWAAAAHAAPYAQPHV